MIEVFAVNVIVVLAGVVAVSVIMGASGERRLRATVVSSAASLAMRSRVALSCAKRVLSCSALRDLSERLALMLILRVRPRGSGTTVGLIVSSGSGLLGLFGIVQVGKTVLVTVETVFVQRSIEHVMILVVVVILGLGVTVEVFVYAATVNTARQGGPIRVTVSLLMVDANDSNSIIAAHCSPSHVTL